MTGAAFEPGVGAARSDRSARSAGSDGLPRRSTRLSWRSPIASPAACAAPGVQAARSSSGSDSTTSRERRARTRCPARRRRPTLCSASPGSCSPSAHLSSRSGGSRWSGSPSRTSSTRGPCSSCCPSTRPAALRSTRRSTRFATATARPRSSVPCSWGAGRVSRCRSCPTELSARRRAAAARSRRPARRAGAASRRRGGTCGAHVRRAGPRRDGVRG